MNVSFNSNIHFYVVFCGRKIRNNNQQQGRPLKVFPLPTLKLDLQFKLYEQILIDRVFLSVWNVVFIQFRVRVSKMSSRVTENIPWRRLSSSLLAKSFFIKYFASISLLFKYSCNKLIYEATFVDVNLFKTKTNILNVMKNVCFKCLNLSWKRFS